MAGPYSTSDIRNYLGLGKQTVRGTGVTPTLFVPSVSAPDLDHGMEGDDISEAGAGPVLSRMSKHSHFPKGGGGVALRPKTFATLLAWFLGQDTTAANGSLYNHTISEAVATVYLTVEQNLADEITERFVDGALISMKLEGPENGGDIQAAFTWEACTPGWRDTQSTEVYETGISGVTPGGVFKMPEAVYEIDGVVDDSIRGWSIDQTWKFDAPQLSKTTRTHIIKLQVSCDITLKRLLLAKDAYRVINYGSTVGTVAGKNFKQDGAFSLLLDNGLATTNSRTIDLDIPQVVWAKGNYTGMDPAGEAVYIEQTGKALKGAGPLATWVCKTADSASYI